MADDSTVTYVTQSLEEFAEDLGADSEMLRSVAKEITRRLRNYGMTDGEIVQVFKPE